MKNQKSLFFIFITICLFSCFVLMSGCKNKDSEVNEFTDQSYDMDEFLKHIHQPNELSDKEKADLYQYYILIEKGRETTKLSIVQNNKEISDIQMTSQNTVNQEILRTFQSSIDYLTKANELNGEVLRCLNLILNEIFINGTKDNTVLANRALSAGSLSNSYLKKANEEKEIAMYSLKTEYIKNITPSKN